MEINSSTIKKIILIFFILLIITIGIFSYSILSKKTIYNGVTVNGVSVGTLNTIDAETRLKEQLDKAVKSKQVLLQHDSYKKDVKYKDLGITYDYSKGVKEAFDIGRKGNIVKRLRDIISVSFNGKNISMDIVKDENKINDLISSIKKDVNKDKKEAKIQYSNGQFTITPEESGLEVDEKKLKSEIIDKIENEDFIKIPVNEVKPTVTKETLSQIKTEIGSFSTTFGTNDANRVHNIRLVSSKIDGKTIMPGEVFSFNKTTGPRSKSAGYKDATIIVNGEFVPGEGGGVCQVSSTLYNAAVLSNTQIVARTHHALPVGYVPHGQDATVAYDYLDLKFKNTFDWPIYIKADVMGNQLLIKLFGKEKNPNRVIKMESEIVERVKPTVETIIDKSLKPGQSVVSQKGRVGYRVNTYKVTYENGAVVEKGLLHKDYYKPKKQIIRKGSK
ncbi:VanW family protein [Gottschalkia purinilytica]|uniref:VanW family protein n=1 Tax=Gottschalkia purinilytica TaxID=1503 RepID=A0A0L0WF81_GOTPU|nr:VanW family protein [Gottschalkia purinilytica]KNF10142.1 VanW family protein [Gottschalkia purinilytica]